MTILGILAIVCGVVGVIGSIIPGLPGPPLSWVGFLLAYLAKGTASSGNPMSLAFLLVWLAVVAVVTLLDYIVPAKFTRLTGGSTYASRGAIAGLLIGLVVPPVGMIAGSLICAFLCEFLLGGKGMKDSLKSSLGAFLGFLTSTGLKLICSAVMMYYIVVYAF